MMFKILYPRPIPEQQTQLVTSLTLSLCVVWLFVLEKNNAFHSGMEAFLMGMAVAVLPVILYVPLALLVDRYEKEPRWMLGAAFLWGATFAVYLVMLLEPGNGPSQSLRGARVEEVVKAIALLMLFFWKADEFDNTVDGIIYATMIGLGFAMTENVHKYADAFKNGTLDTMVMSRGILSPFSHPMFTAMTGLGLGWARETTKPVVKVLAPFGGLALAMGAHMAWNHFLNVWVMLPVFLLMIGVVLYEQGRERKLIHAYLTPYVAAGDLTSAELEMLCRFGGRMQELWMALKVGGWAGLRSQERFHQAASKLAFHQWRIEREGSRDSAADIAREKAYLRTIAECRILPAAAGVVVAG